MYDSLNMHSLESSLIDIMRAEQDPMKSKAAFPSFLCPSRGGRRWCRVCVGGGAIMFAEEARVARCREATGPAAPRAVLFFHTPAYFPPCLELNTCATS